VYKIKKVENPVQGRRYVIQLFSWKYSGEFISNVCWCETRDIAREVRDQLNACLTAFAVSQIVGPTHLDGALIRQKPRKQRKNKAEQTYLLFDRIATPSVN
jgi:hypothetical protein